MVREGDPDEFRLGAVRLVPQQPSTALRAPAVRAFPARRALTAGGDGREDHLVARNHGVHLGSDVHDLADGLVPQDRPGPHPADLAPQRVQVARADRGRLDPHEGVGRMLDHRVVDGFPASLAGAVVDECVHGAHSLSDSRPTAGPQHSQSPSAPRPLRETEGVVLRDIRPPGRRGRRDSPAAGSAHEGPVGPPRCVGRPFCAPAGVRRLGREATGPRIPGRRRMTAVAERDTGVAAETGTWPERLCTHVRCDRKPHGGVRILCAGGSTSSRSGCSLSCPPWFSCARRRSARHTAGPPSSTNGRSPPNSGPTGISYAPWSSGTPRRRRPGRTSRGAPHACRCRSAGPIPRAALSRGRRWSPRAPSGGADGRLAGSPGPRHERARRGP